MCDRVLPWCLPENSDSSPLPEALPGFRWEGRALLIAEAILTDFCWEILQGCGSDEVENECVSKSPGENGDVEALVYGGSVVLISKVNGGEAPRSPSKSLWQEEK